jgi:hypothetical protein
MAATNKGSSASYMQDLSLSMSPSVNGTPSLQQDLHDQTADSNAATILNEEHLSTTNHSEDLPGFASNVDLPLYARHGSPLKKVKTTSTFESVAVNIPSNDSRSTISIGLPPTDNIDEQFFKFSDDPGPSRSGRLPSPPPAELLQEPNSLSRQNTHPSLVPSYRQSMQDASPRHKFVFPFPFLQNRSEAPYHAPFEDHPQQNTFDLNPTLERQNSDQIAEFVARIPAVGVEPRELSRRPTASSSIDRFTALAPHEKTLFIMSVFFFFAIVVTSLSVMMVRGHGNKKLVRSLFLGAILLLMLIVGIGMTMVRRNLAEILFSMTLVLVMGIFVGGGGYLDVIGYGVDG